MVNVTLIASLAGILIIVALFGTNLISFWNDIQTKYQASQQAKLVAPPITKGTEVCTLKVTADVLLTSDVFSTDPQNLQVITTHYNWFNCKTVANTASIITPPLQGMIPNDFLLFSSAKYPVALVITNKNGQLYDTNSLPSLTQYISIPAGVTHEPYETQLIYAVSNVPLDDYKAELSAKDFKIRFTTSTYLPAGSSVSWTISGSQSSG